MLCNGTKVQWTKRKARNMEELSIKILLFHKLSVFIIDTGKDLKFTSLDVIKEHFANLAENFQHYFPEDL